MGYKKIGKDEICEKLRLMVMLPVGLQEKIKADLETG
jgi:hypothetical protein